MCFIAALLIAAAAPAFAEPPPGGDASLTDMPQISRPRAPIPSPPRTVRSSEAPPQLTREKQGAAGPAQLTAGPKTVAAPPQLAGGTRSAQPPTPLSTTRDGRTAAMERVHGEDRCDPEARKRSKAECKRVIENRAAEFRRSEAPVLSPEQRLLIGDPSLEQLGVRAATRRLATTGQDDSSIEAQGVASIVLRQQPPREEKVEQKPSPEAEAAAAAVVNAILNPGPQQ